MVAPICCVPLIKVKAWAVRSVDSAGDDCVMLHARARYWFDLANLRHPVPGLWQLCCVCHYLLQSDWISSVVLITLLTLAK